MALLCDLRTMTFVQDNITIIICGFPYQVVELFCQNQSDLHFGENPFMITGGPDKPFRCFPPSFCDFQLDGCWMDNHSFIAFWHSLRKGLLTHTASTVAWGHLKAKYFFKVYIAPLDGPLLHLILSPALMIMTISWCHITSCLQFINKH